MLAFLLLLPALAQASSPWQSYLDAAGGGVRFGVALEGRDPFEFHANDSFAPASTAKLFTAANALATLGADYRYPTTVRWHEAAPGVATGVEIVGSGDPSMGLSEFNEGIRDRLDAAAAAMRAAGVTRLLGAPRAVAADSRWNRVEIPEGWRDSDPESCEGSLAQAFNFNLNCAALIVTSATEAHWKAPGLDAPVSLSMHSGGSTSIDARLVKSESGNWVWNVYGTFANGSSPRTLIVPVLDNLGWAQNMFRDALVAKGIEISPASAVSGEARSVTVYSRPLSELIKPFLKNSVNFMGDAFLKAAATSSDGGPSLLGPGLGKLMSYLRREAGDTRDVTLHDGSGLSRTSRVTPEFMLRFLSRVKEESYFPALWAAMPIAGVDGTLRNRMKGTPAAGVLHAKTGTLNGVNNLAGYVPSDGSYVPFVVLATSNGEAGAAKNAADKVGAHLAEINRGYQHAVETSQPFPYVQEHDSELFQNP